MNSSTVMTKDTIDDIFDVFENKFGSTRSTMVSTYHLSGVRRVQNDILIDMIREDELVLRDAVDVLLHFEYVSGTREVYDHFDAQNPKLIDESSLLPLLSIAHAKRTIADSNPNIELYKLQKRIIARHNGQYWENQFDMLLEYAYNNGFLTSSTLPTYRSHIYMKRPSTNTSWSTAKVTIDSLPQIIERFEEEFGGFGRDLKDNSARKFLIRDSATRYISSEVFDKEYTVGQVTDRLILFDYLAGGRRVYNHQREKDQLTFVNDIFHLWLFSKRNIIKEVDGQRPNDELSRLVSRTTTAWDKKGTKFKLEKLASMFNEVLEAVYLDNLIDSPLGQPNFDEHVKSLHFRRFGINLDVLEDIVLGRIKSYRTDGSEIEKVTFDELKNFSMSNIHKIDKNGKRLNPHLFTLYQNFENSPLPFSYSDVWDIVLKRMSVINVLQGVGSYKRHIFNFQGSNEYADLITVRERILDKSTGIKSTRHLGKLYADINLVGRFRNRGRRGDNLNWTQGKQVVVAQPEVAKKLGGWATAQQRNIETILEFLVGERLLYDSDSNTLRSIDRVEDIYLLHPNNIFAYNQNGFNHMDLYSAVFQIEHRSLTKKTLSYQDLMELVILQLPEVCLKMGVVPNYESDINQKAKRIFLSAKYSQQKSTLPLYLHSDFYDFHHSPNIGFTYDSLAVILDMMTHKQRQTYQSRVLEGMGIAEIIKTQNDSSKDVNKHLEIAEWHVDKRLYNALRVAGF